MTGGGMRFALFILQIGAVAVVLAASPHAIFDLDRFLVPKELVLHLTALLAGVVSLRVIRRSVASRIDLLLGGYLLLSAISAVLATNRWLGLRALAISASGVMIFWTARALRDAGLARPLLAALSFAVVVAAVVALVQAYGLQSTLFASTRVPGGTLGHRNFVAHIAAFGLPVWLFVELRARGAGGVV